MTVNRAPFTLKGRRTLLLAEGNFSTLGSKTAVCYLRYRGEDVAAVLDSTCGSARASDVVGIGGDVPIVSNMEEAMRFHPDVAIVGVAPRGGRWDPQLRQLVLDCVEAGIDVVSGLHTFLADDADISAAAKKRGARLWDVRHVGEAATVASGRGCTTGAKVVLVTGTDCNVGKMTATVELYNEAQRRGINVAWAATGQTGIILRERGICIDRVIADFIGGAAEELVTLEGRDKDLVIVEGQGSLIHPGYAGVTLGLMFGVVPDCMVLSHEFGRSHVRNYDVDMPPLEAQREAHELIMAPLKTSPVVAVALNTAGSDTREAEEIISQTREETGLATGDPVRFGAAEILDAVMNCLS
jgi:uncharacterized NAD-dependent epimerase/dehydratase family protein